jgi:hypothetical protein
LQVRRLPRRPGRQLARWLIAAIRDNDERKVEKPVLQLARTRRIFAPLVLAAGAFVTLFNGGLPPDQTGTYASARPTPGGPP